MLRSELLGLGLAPPDESCVARCTLSVSQATDGTLSIRDLLPRDRGRGSRRSCGSREAHVGILAESRVARSLHMAPLTHCSAARLVGAPTSRATSLHLRGTTSRAAWPSYESPVIAA